MHYDADSIENRDERVVERVASAIEPFLNTFFRPVVRGLERIPHGKGLYVANHNGGVLFPDAYVIGDAIFRNCGIEHLPYVLGHDIAVKAPIANSIFPPIGVVRASPGNARRLFAAGRKVLVFPGGDVEVMRPFKDRNKIVFGERKGYLRLAITEDVPVIPVVTAGAHSCLVILDDGGRVARFLGIDRALRVKVCPIVLSFPWGLTIGFPPPYLPLPTRFYTEFLEPIRFERKGEEAANDEAYIAECHRQVVAAMQAALTRLARERYIDKRQRHIDRIERLTSAMGASEKVRDALLALSTRLKVTPSEEFEHQSSAANSVRDERGVDSCTGPTTSGEAEGIAAGYALPARSRSGTSSYPPASMTGSVGLHAAGGTGGKYDV